MWRMGKWRLRTTPPSWAPASTTTTAPSSPRTVKLYSLCRTSCLEFLSQCWRSFTKEPRVGPGHPSVINLNTDNFLRSPSPRSVPEVSDWRQTYRADIHGVCWLHCHLDPQISGEWEINSETDQLSFYLTISSAITVTFIMPFEQFDSM